MQLQNAFALPSCCIRRIFFLIMPIDTTKFPGLCVFCASEGLTKEHIWPDWLKHAIPRKDTSHVFATGESQRRRGSLESSEQKVKWGTGDLHSQKLKVVCADCNHGWMSQLQERAKPVLLPLINGTSENFDFTEDQCRLIASWAMMFTMVVEFRDALTGAITYEERNAFKLDARPNDKWKVWTGRKKKISSKDPWNFYHYAWGLIDGPIPEGVSYKHSTQTTTFLVGKLVFHTFSTRDDFFDVGANQFGLSHGLRAVWPAPDREFSRMIGIPPVLSGEDIHRLSRTLVEAIEPDYPDPLPHYKRKAS